MMDNFSAACRKAGLKLTHQRYKVYLELLKSCDHPAAEALYKRLLVKIPTISLDTVTGLWQHLNSTGLFRAYRLLRVSQDLKSRSDTITI